MKPLPIIIFVALVGLGLFGLALLGSKKTDTDIEMKPVEPTADDHRMNADAEIVVIEYSDLQCPACRAYAPMVKQLAQEYDGRVTFIYRHFPLPQHQNAMLAAQAAEAAGIQEKLFEMHDILFEKQPEWEKSTDSQAREQFIAYAQTLQLDAEKFKTDIELQNSKDRIQRDIQSGFDAGVNSTPTFFVNGIKIDNPKNYEDFKTGLESLIPAESATPTF